MILTGKQRRRFHLFTEVARQLFVAATLGSLVLLAPLRSLITPEANAEVHAAAFPAQREGATEALPAQRMVDYVVRPEAGRKLGGSTKF